jgi:hypothetical protein
MMILPNKKKTKQQPKTSWMKRQVGKYPHHHHRHHYLRLVSILVVALLLLLAIIYLTQLIQITTRFHDSLADTMTDSHAITASSLSSSSAVAVALQQSKQTKQDGTSSLRTSLEASLLDCQTVLKTTTENNDNNTATSATNNTDAVWVHVTKSPATNSFYIAIHNRTFDPVRWDIAVRQRYYETDLEVTWKHVLDNAIMRKTNDDNNNNTVTEPIRILDVGANIGYFGLYSAALVTASGVATAAAAASSHVNNKNKHHQPTVSVIVDAFEPYMVNLHRTCESIQRNGWSSNEWQWQREDKLRKKKMTRMDTVSSSSSSCATAVINLWPWGVSNHTSETTMALIRKKNPGANRILPWNEVQEYIQNRKDVVDSTPVSVPTISLDDFARKRQWLVLQPSSLSSSSSSSTHNESNPQQPTKPQYIVSSTIPQIDILKIDVEKHEAQVILGATQLLQSRQVQHVFVEFARDASSSSLHSRDRDLSNQALHVLRQAGYTLCGWGSFQGPRLGTVPLEVLQSSNNSNDSTTFVTNFWKQVGRQRGIAVNLWWQLDPHCGY